MVQVPDYAAGLEGVIVNETGLSRVDGAEGKLYYCGYTIEDLVKYYDFETVSYLLLYKRLPTKQELQEFDAELKAERALTPRQEAGVVLTLKQGHPMAVLQTLVANIAMYDEDIDIRTPEAMRKRAIKIIAKMPTIVTLFDALRSGREVVRPRKDLSHAANMLYMLTGKEQEEVKNKLFDAALILHMDHGCNASTFAARVIASTEANIYTSIVGAIGALSGALHGGANERVVRMLDEIKSEDKVEAFINEKIKNREKIMGFGHRVYKVWDPRATILRSMAEDMASKAPESSHMVKLAEKVASVALEKFAEIGKSDIYPNVDFFSGAVYTALGLPIDFFTPVFAISRVVGWAAHHIEQMENNRIYRPRLVYSGDELGRAIPTELAD